MRLLNLWISCRLLFLSVLLTWNKPRFINCYFQLITIINFYLQTKIWKKNKHFIVIFWMKQTRNKSFDKNSINHWRSFIGSYPRKCQSRLNKILADWVFLFIISVKESTPITHVSFLFQSRLCKCGASLGLLFLTIGH